CRTASVNRERGTTSSTRPQSTARRPFTPSSVVQKKSARSRRTFRLSTNRVSPPVPGSTASSGTSGSDTAVLASSAITIHSVARASSYPPPAHGPLIAVSQTCLDSFAASSIALPVSLLTLQN